jgi:SAM-dependent methyltransferase
MENKAVKFEKTVCDFCGNAESEMDYITKDNTNFSPGLFNVVSCKECGLSYLDPRPLSENMGAYYEEEYYSEVDGGRFNSPAEKIIRWFRGKRVALLARFSKKGRVLDIGSDRGTFLSILRGKGWKVNGTQLSKQSADAAKKIYGIDLQVGDLLDIKYPSRHFDAVVLWHVLEHVFSPSRYIEEISRILKPGGTLLLEVPDAGSVQARFFRDRWLICEAPRHLYFFNMKQLSRVLNKYSLNIVNSGHFSLEMGPFTMLQSMLNVVFGNDNYLFNMMKSKNIRGRRQKGSYYSGLYLITAAALAPLALFLSCVLSIFGSGEVVRIVAKKRNEI